MTLVSRTLKKPLFSRLAATLAFAILAAVPAFAAATEDSPWQKMFPAGLIRAGQKADAASQQNVALLDGKFVGVYRSAIWCGPCRKFTPQLVKFYAKNKKDIEIVFWSADQSEDAMREYVKTDKMKWLAVPYGKNPAIALTSGGIPCLIVFSPDGKEFTKITGATSDKNDPRLEKLLKDMNDWRKKNPAKNGAKK